jgi:hypothetical protein
LFAVTIAGSTLAPDAFASATALGRFVSAACEDSGALVELPQPASASVMTSTTQEADNLAQWHS